MLHEDITKHWLVRELTLLQNLIDRANEKGWRKELFEYLERKQLLQTPSEQSRLLLEVPKVTADEIDQEATPQEGSYGSPRSILKGASEISTCELEANQTLSTKNFSSTDAAEDQPVQFVQEHKKMHHMNLEEFEEDSHGKIDEHKQVVVATQVIEVSDDKEVEDAGGQLSVSNMALCGSPGRRTGALSNGITETWVHQLASNKHEAVLFRQPLTSTHLSFI